jgi:hypothetical protein
MAQVVEHLPSKQKAMSSNPSKKERKKENEERKRNPPSMRWWRRNGWKVVMSTWLNKLSGFNCKQHFTAKAPFGRSGSNTGFKKGFSLTMGLSRAEVNVNG